MRNYIANHLKQTFGVSEQKAEQSTSNILTNYANCAGISVKDVADFAPINIKHCYDTCFAGAHAAHPNDIDLFEKAIIGCMCECAKTIPTQQ